MTSRVRSRTGVLTADYAPGATFGPRRLVDHEFVWLLQGSAHWQIDGVRHELRPGVLALGRPGQQDRFDWDVDRRSRHRFVHFLAPDAPAGAPPGDAVPQLRTFEELPVLAALCDFLGDLAADPTERARRRSEQALAWLYDLFTGEPTPPERRTDAGPTDPLAPAWRAVAADWAEHGPRIVDVDTLAAAAGVSRGHLFRLFRQRFGCGPARALELVRLARAATALQRSNGSLAAVAVATGFADAYHLSHRFGPVYGCPPGEYRRRDGADPTVALRKAGLLAVAQRLG